MKKTFLIASLFAIVYTSFAQSEQPIGQMKDIITILSGKYIATEFIQVLLVDGTSIEVKSDAIAPSSGVISKESFVHVFSTITMQAIYELIPEGITKITYLAASGGNPDIEVNMLMSKTGMQTVVTSNTKNSGTKRTAYMWNEIFK